MTLVVRLAWSSRSHATVRCQALDTGLDFTRSEALGQAAFLQMNLGPASQLATLAWVYWSTPMRSKRMVDVWWASWA